MPKRILIIDDDLTNTKTIESRLIKEGYEVICAFDGDVGLQRVKEGQPDLIILDVEMPRMNGYTFKTELNKDANLRNIPVIVLTSHEENQPIFQLKGVKTYLIKPVNLDSLIEKINSHFK